MRMPTPALSLPIVSAALLAAASPAVHAVDINAGAEGSAYHATLCPPIAKELGNARLEYACVASAGPVETLRRIAADPRQLGFVTLDVLAKEAPALGGARAFARVRSDDTRECLLAVTRNGTLASYDDIAAEAARLRFLLPPKASGSAQTFAILQQIDAGGIAKAGSVLNAESAAEAVKLALSAEDTVAVISTVANPHDPLFKLVAAQGGRILAVVSREILRHQVGGEKVYFAEEVPAGQPRWLRAAATVVTACTPTVVVTGASDRVADPKARQDHRDMVATLQAAKSAQLVPAPGLMRRLVDRSRDLSAAGAERMRGLTRSAREGSEPYVDRAKGAASKAAEATRPAFDKAREITAEALAKARQQAKELMEKSAPAEAPKQP